MRFQGSVEILVELSLCEPCIVYAKRAEKYLV